MAQCVELQTPRNPQTRHSRSTSDRRAGQEGRDAVQRIGGAILGVGGFGLCVGQYAGVVVAACSSATTFVCCSSLSPRTVSVLATVSWSCPGQGSSRWSALRGLSTVARLSFSRSWESTAGSICESSGSFARDFLGARVVARRSRDRLRRRQHPLTVPRPARRPGSCVPAGRCAWRASVCLIIRSRNGHSPFGPGRRPATSDNKTRCLRSLRRAASVRTRRRRRSGGRYARRLAAGRSAAGRRDACRGESVRGEIEVG